MGQAPPEYADLHNTIPTARLAVIFLTARAPARADREGFERRGHLLHAKYPGAPRAAVLQRRRPHGDPTLAAFPVPNR